MKTVYQTCDGEVFEDRSEAVAHEECLFDDWVANLIEGRFDTRLHTVVRHFNDSAELTCKEASNYYGTAFDMLKESLKLFWKDEMDSLLKHTTHPKRSD